MRADITIYVPGGQCCPRQRRTLRVNLAVGRNRYAPTPEVRQMLVLFLALVAVGKLLTLRECAERTGNKLSTWRAWVLRRKVPYYKLSRSIRVAESDLERMIEQARVPAREVRK